MQKLLGIVVLDLLLSGCGKNQNTSFLVKALLKEAR